jgi:diadenosine tetraphosphate (Ap4A) HIT family hydrolase
VADAYLQRADIQRGYTVVVWRGPHVADPTELSEEDAAAYWLEVLRVARAIGSHFRPIKLNFDTLGNTVPHLHTHVVPRYLGDENPGGPLPFMMASGPYPVMPEDRFRSEVASLRALLA